MIQGARLGAVSLLAALSFGLAACGGGSSSTPTSTTATTTPTSTTYTVGGTLSGLASGQSVTLLNNGGDGYIATTDGTFTFATGVTSGTSYVVTVGTPQPTGQTCSVTHGTGLMGSSNVTTATVNCITNGLVVTFAGSTAAGSTDGTGAAASFDYPYKVATDASGNVYVSDHNNNVIRKITTAGVVSTFAGSGAFGSTDGPVATASFFYPSGVATDASGNVYVADDNNHKIRKINPAGVVSTFAGSGILGSSDGPAATASFNHPAGLATDASGNVYVADPGNNEIRKITQAGVVSTFAGSGATGSADGPVATASFNTPIGVATDASGNVYVADTYNHKIRKITQAGMVTTVAGSGAIGSAEGTGTAASFNYPYDVATDASGNVYVADDGNHKIRKITPAGVVSTLAGTGSFGSADGIGTAASFSSPTGLATDASGNLYVADQINNEIRKITP